MAISAVYLFSNVSVCRGAVVLGQATLFVPAVNFSQVFWSLQQDELDPDLIVCGAGSSLATVNKLTGEFITIAGDENGTSDYVEGVGSLARFNKVAGVAQTRTHYIISDTFNNCVRSVLRNSHETNTFAGRCLDIGTNDGPLLTARLRLPRGLTKYNDDILYLCDYNSVRIIDLSTGYLRTHLSQTTSENLLNIVIQSTGDLLISAAHGLLRTMGTEVQWVAGGPNEGVGCDNCSLSAASFHSPWGVSLLTPTVVLITNLAYRGLTALNMFSNTAHLIYIPAIIFPTSLLVDHHNNTIYIGEWEREGGGLWKLPFSGKV